MEIEDSTYALFEYDHPYGKKRYRPVNTTATVLTLLTGQDSFPEDRFAHAMALGFSIGVTAVYLRQPGRKKRPAQRPRKTA